MFIKLNARSTNTQRYETFIITKKPSLITTSTIYSTRNSLTSQKSCFSNKASRWSRVGAMRRHETPRDATRRCSSPSFTVASFYVTTLFRRRLSERFCWLDHETRRNRAATSNERQVGSSHRDLDMVILRDVDDIACQSIFDDWRCLRHIVGATLRLLEVEAIIDTPVRLRYTGRETSWRRTRRPSCRVRRSDAPNPFHRSVCINIGRPAHFPLTGFARFQPRCYETIRAGVDQISREQRMTDKTNCKVIYSVYSRVVQFQFVHRRIYRSVIQLWILNQR